MRVCNTCGTKFKDGLERCPTCRSADFVTVADEVVEAEIIEAEEEEEEEDEPVDDEDDDEEEYDDPDSD